MALGSDIAKMRQRASRLLDLATRSRCEGRSDYASLLTDLATEILEHARDVEQRNESAKINASIGNRNLFRRTAELVDKILRGAVLADEVIE